MFLPRLVESVQAHRGGVLFARRAIRRRSVLALSFARQAQRRNYGAAPRAAAEPTPEIVEEPKRKSRLPAEPVIPLEKCLDRFWDVAENLDDFAVKIEAPTVDAVPVKRLGAPGFWRDSKVDFIALFARAYTGITDGAIRTALGSADTSK
jgi:hypothetical protein